MPKSYDKYLDPFGSNYPFLLNASGCGVLIGDAFIRSNQEMFSAFAEYIKDALSDDVPFPHEAHEKAKQAILYHGEFDKLKGGE